VGAHWLRDELAVAEARALLPLATVPVTVHPVTVRNPDDKIVARIAVEASDAATVVRLVPVRGYPKALARARAAIDGAGLQPTDQDLLALALASGSTVPTAPALPRMTAVDAAQPAGAAFVRVLTALLDGLAANESGVHDDTDTEFLHDYRVAVRRSRSVLKHAAQVLPDELVACFAPELRWLQEVTGPTRDLDVHLEALEQERATLPEDRAADLQPVADFLAGRRSDAYHAMVAALASERALALLADWRGTLGALAEATPRPDVPVDADEWGPWPEGAARAVAEVAARCIRRRYRRFVKEGRAIDDDSPPERLHDLRKTGKELRYLIELFGGLFTEGLGGLAKDMKVAQDDLGAYQDSRIQLDLLHHTGQDLAATGAAGAGTLLAMGMLVDRLDERQAAARRRFAGLFAAVASPETQRRIDALGRDPATG
jgi:CHAD domain-containing protein